MPRFRSFHHLTRCLLLAGVLATRAAVAQEAPVEDRDRDCPPAPPRSTAPAPAITSPCITVDASRSIDPLAGPLKFRWQMGDGQTREGVVFDYCYAELGRYVIILDVLDSLTGEVRQHEMEGVVDFKKPGANTITYEPALRFEAPERAKVGEEVTFVLTEAELPTCLPPTVRFNWNFRDGLLAQGRTVKHTFRRAGTFAVRLAIDGSGTEQCLPRGCVSRVIVIE